MRRPMETVQDLIEEAKVRMVWWGLCIFGITYFLSHTSKSMWMNLPISIVILCAFRYLSYEVELHWKVQPIHRQTYLSHLRRRQLLADDFHLSAMPHFPSWKRKLNSPPVEAAVHDFINKVLQDFMVDLWYSSITPDGEAPELIRVLIMDAIGTVSWRIKDINLVNLLTRDMVELISNHLDLFRRNKSTIGVEVMETLSLEQIDERLRHHLIDTQELHPALKSAESEYKVLQRLVEGVLGIVLDPREAQSPLVRCFSRELLTCLVLEPVMNLANPAYINELIETIFLASKNDDDNRQVRNDDSKTFDVPASHDHSVPQSNKQDSSFEVKNPTCNHPGDMIVTTCSGKISSVHQDAFPEDSGKSLNIKPAEWARVLDAATERRTQVLAPENLENMWTKGRNYRKKATKLSKAVASHGNVKMTSGIVDNYIQVGAGKEILPDMKYVTTDLKDKNPSHLTYGSHSNSQSSQIMIIPIDESKVTGRMPTSAGGCSTDGSGCGSKQFTISNNNQLKRSSSTSDIKRQHNIDSALTDKPEELVDSRELCYPIHAKQKGKPIMREVSEHVSHSEGSLHVPKLKCRVVGAYFEKIGSNSFAVYSIAVTDAQNMTWFVKRRYRNFERLHRHLKDIPNYVLHLPPKRFLSSSIDDYFVHQRCILLDKYLQELLSIANIAEQHEVWDFLSATSKNYSFGKSTSVMKTLAVNVDDAMDDIVRQFKGVSIGLRRKVVGSPPSPSHFHTASALKAEKSTYLSYTEENRSKPCLSFTNTESSQSVSEDDIHDEEGSTDLIGGWHSDNELSSRHFPPRVVKSSSESRSLGSQRSERTENFGTTGLDQDFPSNSLVASGLLEDKIGVPPEWSPPNVSVPLLNLVDNIFQLKRRGWLRRQVFWISKQILQLIMEDAIDDWLLRQINWLRKDEVIAQGIRWLQDVLWPNGIFFTKLEGNQAKTVVSPGSPTNQKSVPAIGKAPISFEQQLEAARRASDVKKIILGGAPTTLVSLIGHKQYKRCAKDIYHFLQSTICMKQLAYGMLELLLISVFPELQDIVEDINKKSHTQPT